MSIKFVPPTEEELAARGVGAAEPAKQPAAEAKPEKPVRKKKG